MEGTTQVGVEVTSPRAYPHTVAVTYGGNSHLDSKPLKDELCDTGNCITSGKDGIINTFFAPRYISYEAVPNKIPNPPYFFGARDNPAIIPGDADYPVLDYPDWSGPGDPDNPEQYDMGANLITPLSGYTGASNLGGFLLADDHWDTTLFGSTTPPKYLQEQQCTFYEMGERFNQCAMGAPIDPATGKEPVSVVHGGDNVLHTVEKNLKGDDYLCKEVNGSTVKVGICVGNNGKLDIPDLYTPLQGDDRLEIVRDIGGPDPNALIVGIGPGSDGVLQTEAIGIPSQYFLADEIDSDFTMSMGNFEAYLGADYYCETLDGITAICPGPVEQKQNFYDASLTVTGSRKLM
jgi:hypothetical protein